MPRVAVIGATGQIGRPLCRELLSAGYSVTVVSRDPDRAAGEVAGAAAYVAWDPASPEFARHLEAADAVVYLAGAPLFDGRKHDRAYVEAESQARVGAMGQLIAVLGGLSGRPATLVAASSVGFYGYAESGDAPVDESCPAGTDWWGRDSESIERAALAARTHGLRTVVLRTGYVLTERSLAAQVAQFQKNFGGWIGSGRSWTPWIHMADGIGLIRFALEHPDLNGPLNLTAPEPVRGRELRDCPRPRARSARLAARARTDDPDGPRRGHRYHRPREAGRSRQSACGGLRVPFPLGWRQPCAIRQGVI
jgi:uncharacterized protein